MVLRRSSLWFTHCNKKKQVKILDNYTLGVLTGFSPFVCASAAATVLAFRVAVFIIGVILVTVAVLRSALSQRYYPDVVYGTMPAVTAGVLAVVPGCPVLNALAKITLASLNTLYVFHSSGYGYNIIVPPNNYIYIIDYA